MDDQAEQMDGAVGERRPSGVTIDPSGRPRRPSSWRLSSWWPWLRGRLSATRAGRVALRAVVAVAGTAVVAVGLVLVPLPGPGWLIVFAGVTIWAVEFHWARRLLGYGRWQLRRWTVLMRTGPWALRFTVGLASAALVGLAVWFSLRYAGRADLARWIRT